MLPLFLIVCATVLGLMLAAVEEWEAGIGSPGSALCNSLPL